MPNLDDLIHEIDWMPIDLPRCPYSADLFNPTYDHPHSWKFDRLTDKTAQRYAPTELNKDLDQRFPLLASWLRHLPYSSLRYVKINFQQEQVRPHRDFSNPEADRELFDNNLQNEPCGYRVLIKGQRDKLYIIRDGQKIYPNMPDETDVYVLRQTDTLHGVDDDPGRAVLYAHFEIDPDLNRALLARSYRKYGQFALFRA